MEITFLGTGTSQGVPMIACECEVCQSVNQYDKRLRSSVMIHHQQKNIVIDTGPDFRTQMLRENVKTLDAILFTHEHKDHTAGLDDIRAFNYFNKKSIPIFCSEHAARKIKSDFDYVFSDKKYPGIPEIDLHIIQNNSFKILDLIEIIPVELLHYKLPVFGFRIEDFTYITDANFISEHELEKIKGTKILVLNALRKEKHISHFTLDEAIELAQKVNAEKTYFTHISHQLGLHEIVSKQLPENIFLAFDGLKIKC
jgi:phosphoribosyl 1,2-cyclic phosphate phosphodiesterase